MTTIDSVIARCAARTPDRIALREWSSGLALRYSEFDAAVSSFAAWARGAGVESGDCIAIHLPNAANYLIAQFGAFRAGAVAAYINNRLSGSEALRQIKMCKARVVVTTAEKAAELRGAPDLAGALFVVADAPGPGDHSLATIIAANAKLPQPLEGLADTDAIVRFTSGSTGAPKGLIVTHRSWLVRAVSILAEEMPIVSRSTTLVLGQLSHQAGLFAIPTFLKGGTFLMLEKFDLDDVADILSSKIVSCAQIVPTMFGLILNHARARAALANAGLHQIVYGGSPIRRELLDELLTLLPQTNLTQVYGSHEAGSITYLDGASVRNPALRASCGRPLLAVEVRVRKAPGDAIGEIEVKSPWIPHARLTENGREPITEQWSSTGDVGEVIDGYVFLRDRMHDVIISGGFNVYPLEVEAAIGSDPSVLDCAVASAPDDKWGERVIAFVVPRDATRFDAEHLREHCKSRLANYKVPKAFQLVPEIPVNATGKPDRRKLSEGMWVGRSRRIN